MAAGSGGHDRPALSAVPTEPDDGGGGDVDAEASLLLDEFKGLAAAQVDLAERISSRSRQAFAYVSAFFAVAQAGTLVSFSSHAVSRADRNAILGLAIAAVCVLGITGVLSLVADIMHPYEAVGQQDVEDAADSDDVALVLAKRYQRQVRTGEGVLAVRRRLLLANQMAAGVAMLVVVAEIIVAMVAHT